MASQISHIAYAIDFIDLSYQIQDINNESFIRGCLFPDIIRLSKTLSREATHNAFAIDLSFKNLDSFQAGWKFHLYCDKNRERFLKASGFYEIPHTKDASYASNKILEDILIYDKYTDHYKQIIQSLDGFDNLIKTNIASQSALKKWYTSISRYIAQKPNDESIRIMLRDFNTPENQIKDVLNSIGILINNPEVTNLLKNVSKNIDSSIKKEVA